MGQKTFHNVRCDLHITMRMLSKSSCWLNQIVITNSEYTKARSPLVFRKREMETR
eukprot:Awhi_evm1s190